MISPVKNLRLTKARSLALVALALLAAPIAAADGVIVKSTSMDYPVGSLVAKNEILRLGAGQTVTILDRSGVLLEQQKAGAYVGPSERDAAGVVEIATALAAGPQAKSGIGGTRPAPEQACSLSTSAATDACTPRGIVRKNLRVTGYTPAGAGVATQLVLESNFDGYAICVGWNPSEDSRYIPGSDPAHPIELSAEAPAKLGSTSTRSYPSLKSASCVGVSAEVWRSLTPSAIKALNPNSAAIVLSAFSRLRGDTIAEGRAPAPAAPQP